MTNPEHNFRDNESRDHDLRERFAALRRVEEAQAPRFAPPLRANPGWNRRWSPAKLSAIAACMATILAVVLWMRPGTHEPEPGGKPVASLAAWKSPTDFLLQMPGIELLQSVPEIGVWPDYTAPSQPRRKQGPTGKQFSPKEKL